MIRYLSFHFCDPFEYTLNSRVIYFFWFGDTYSGHVLLPAMVVILRLIKVLAYLKLPLPAAIIGAFVGLKGSTVNTCYQKLFVGQVSA